MLALGLWGTVAQAHATGQTWYLVQPMVRDKLIEPLTRHYAKVLPQYLDGKVVLKNTGKINAPERVRASLDDERADSTVALMSPLFYDRIREDEEARKTSDKTLFLLLMAKRPWCLATTHDVQPRNQAGMTKWLNSLRRPVRLGLVSLRGMPAVWVQAVERKTGLDWVTTDFFNNVDQGMVSLQAGDQDFLLDSCAEINRMRAQQAGGPGRDKIQLLITDQKELGRDSTSFAQWKLPAPAPSWVAWFVSSKMPEARRQQMARALHAVSMREDTQALVREMGKEPVSWTVQGSQQYFENWLRDWKSVSNWMNNLPDMGHAPPGPYIP